MILSWADKNRARQNLLFSITKLPLLVYPGFDRTRMLKNDKILIPTYFYFWRDENEFRLNRNKITSKNQFLRNNFLNSAIRTFLLTICLLCETKEDNKLYASHD